MCILTFKALPFIFCPCRACGSKLPVSLTAYSVVGAAAYMGGATRMTLTTTVMVMETTGALQLIVPIMLTVFVAKVSAGQVQLPPGWHHAVQFIAPLMPTVAHLRFDQLRCAVGHALHDILSMRLTVRIYLH